MQANLSVSRQDGRRTGTNLTRERPLFNPPVGDFAGRPSDTSQNFPSVEDTVP
jgi:hypothetical protein